MPKRKRDALDAAYRKALGLTNDEPLPKGTEGGSAKPGKIGRRRRRKGVNK